eukprot:1908219-Amphidinium_carterae.1
MRRVSAVPVQVSVMQPAFEIAVTCSMCDFTGTKRAVLCHEVWHHGRRHALRDKKCPLCGAVFTSLFACRRQVAHNRGHVKLRVTSALVQLSRCRSGHAADDRGRECNKQSKPRT